VGLALDEPEENDKVVTINDIKVAIDSDIESFTENLVLDSKGLLFLLSCVNAN
jgi:Fe-S cluster assembly iron-binding protein IscA